MLFTKLSKRLALCLKKSQGKGAGTRGHRTYTRKKENIPAKKDMKHLVFRVRTHYSHTLQKRVGMETEVTMSTLFYLSSAQMDTIRPFFPRSRGVPRVDDQKILSGIIYVLKFGLQWKDAPKEYGPYKTLYNRFVRWSKMGVFEKIFTALAENSQDTSLLMIDATHLKAHRTAASLRKKGLLPDVSDEQRED